MHPTTLFMVLFATLTLGAVSASDFDQRGVILVLKRQQEHHGDYHTRGRIHRSTRYFKLCGNNLIQKVVLTCKGCLKARHQGGNTIKDTETSITHTCCIHSHCSDHFLKSLCCDDPLFD